MRLFWSILAVISLLFLFPIPAFSFIVGGCIGPKSVLERFLNDKQKSELRKMVHNKFDGSNAEQILEESNRYVYGHITEEQWHSIVPELAEYQAKNHECSVYAQLLPKTLYQQLLKSVLRASEMGASKYDVKRLVDDYVDRLAKNGVLPDVMDKTPTLPRVTLPEPDIAAQSYRKYPKKPPMPMGNGNPNQNLNLNLNSQKSKNLNMNSKTKTKNGGNMKNIPTVHPTLVGFPENMGQRRSNNRENARKLGKPKSSAKYGGMGGASDRMNPGENIGMPMFPIARPTPFDLSEYMERGNGRSNHRTAQNFRRYPEHECDYYAGPCATSF